MKLRCLFKKTIQLIFILQHEQTIKCIYIFEINCINFRGSVANCGSAVKWLSSLGLINSPQESGELASKVKDTGEVYFVPA